MTIVSTDDGKAGKGPNHQRLARNWVEGGGGPH